MEIITHRGYKGRKAGTALALGYFDGLHIGHVAVIRAARRHAEAHGLDLAVFTFAPGSAAGLKGRQILPCGEKYGQLARLGVGYCFEPSFASLRALPPEAFFHRLLLERYAAKALFCGQNYGFGAARAGTVELLEELAGQAGIGLEVLPLAHWRGAPVSSTRIRRALAAGEMKSVHAMLGRVYEVSFSTDDIKPFREGPGFVLRRRWEGIQLPGEGVYATVTWVGGLRAPSVTRCKTEDPDGAEMVMETFTDGFSPAHLTAGELAVEFHRRLAGRADLSVSAAAAQGRV